jgi:glucokinase-like ROK family protein
MRSRSLVLMAERPPRAKNGAGTDHGVMRELNRTLVLDVLRHDSSPLSRAAIAKRTGLAKPTVSAIVDDLLADDLVRELGTGRTTTEGGRPPILLEFNARSQHLIGVHVGVVHTNVVLADARGDELDRIQVATPANDPDTVMDRIATVVEDLLRSAGVARRAVAGVGVCVPGLVDLHRGTCLFAPNLGWRDVGVSEALQERLDCPVHVHNTAQACAVAEADDGAAKGAAEVALLYAGTGVGAGLISDGQLRRGWAGIAGEIGHCRVGSGTERCSCGKLGCLETVTSAPALLRAARSTGLALDGAAGPALEALGDAAAAGDRRAREVIGAAGRELGLAASWLVNLFNPEVLIIGGGLAGLGEVLLAPLRDVALTESLPQAAMRVSIRPWALGQDAKVRGAVLVARQAAEVHT